MNQSIINATYSFPTPSITSSSTQSASSSREYRVPCISLRGDPQDEPWNLICLTRVAGNHQHYYAWLRPIKSVKHAQHHQHDTYLTTLPSSSGFHNHIVTILVARLPDVSLIHLRKKTMSSPKLAMGFNRIGVFITPLKVHGTCRMEPWRVRLSDCYQSLSAYPYTGRRMPFCGPPPPKHLIYKSSLTSHTLGNQHPPNKVHKPNTFLSFVQSIHLHTHTKEKNKERKKKKSKTSSASPKDQSACSSPALSPSSSPSWLR